MFRHLQIYDPRERVLVGLADAGLTVAAGAARLVSSRRARGRDWPRRILLLRLERIGDLLMSAPAIAAVRECAPDAHIDLIVGSWNASIARLIPGIDRVETLDASWLSRGSGGGGMRALMAQARGWRTRDYDLAINFEGDIRSHLLVALSGATERAGFTMAGGGPLLTRRFEFDPRQHTTANAWRLVQDTFAALGIPAGSAQKRAQPPESLADSGADSSRRSSVQLASAPAAERRAMASAGSAPTRAVPLDRPENSLQKSPDFLPLPDAGERAGVRGLAGGGAPPFRLQLPALARERAAALLGRHPRVIALHASGGREIKQWPPERFAEAAARIAREYDATLLLTGSPGDRAIVDIVRAKLPDDIATIDLTGELDLPILGAVLERCDLFLTGDTGPMHLAAAVGTPTVAVFGPSDPARYAPISTRHRVVRIDLPCAPCNRIRLPPQRCQGHTPDCLQGVTVDAVVAAARELRREVEHEQETAR